MVDNENACFLNARGVLESIASRARSYRVLVKLVANGYNSTHGQRAFPHLAF